MMLTKNPFHIPPKAFNFFQEVVGKDAIQQFIEALANQEPRPSNASSSSPKPPSQYGERRAHLVTESNDAVSNSDADDGSHDAIDVPKDTNGANLDDDNIVAIRQVIHAFADARFAMPCRTTFVSPYVSTQIAFL